MVPRGCEDDVERVGENASDELVGGERDDRKRKRRRL